jgi:hypothetical protein
MTGFREFGRSVSGVRACLLRKIASVAFVPCVTLVVVVAQGRNPHKWRAEGDILEACSCEVPCPCNFGEWPRAHRYCDSLAVFRFATISVGGQSLRPGNIAIAGRALNQDVIILDPGVPPETEEFLVSFAKSVAQKNQARVAGIYRESFETVTNEGGYRLKIGDKAQLEAEYLQGNRPNTRLKLTNPIIFGDLPLTSTIKARAHLLKVAAPPVAFQYAETNGNHAFFWVDDTDILLFR